ncbi:MAG TPA: VWA domain-containing protein, partial [Nocardioides sp.]|nr:VWA domain-containing protein [Nocardioides sp.]
MTRSDLTQLYFLLDRSGSMQSIKSDIEGGFAAFVDEQRAAAGSCRATLAQFDDAYDIVYADRPIAEVPALDLQPRGMTALHDAMGRLITDTGQALAALPEDQRPGTVIVAIMTDGLENASK